MAQASTATRRKKTPDQTRAEPSTRRQRLTRDIALILIAPLLLYLLVCLVTFSPSDPSWSQSGSVTAPLHNRGGQVGAWLADILLYLTGYVAFLLPVVLGLIAWIALFRADTRNPTMPTSRRAGPNSASSSTSASARNSAIHAIRPSTTGSRNAT